MYIHAKIACSSVNGPGNRAVIFFQGCSLRCAGCHNPKTHKPGLGAWESMHDLVAWIKERQGIEGVTFSGGEPLEQLDDGLDLLVYSIRTDRPDLSIGLFTGYSEEELEAGNFKWTVGSNGCAPKCKKADGWRWLRTKLDWAVMGRYNQLQRSAEPMLASANQKLLLFSDRYAPADFAEQRVELIILGETGGAVITGFPPSPAQGEAHAQ